MKDDIIEQQKDIYRKSFSEHGPTPKGVLCNTVRTQYIRFDKLLKNFDIEKLFSIHDIGCGTCALHEYLLEKKIAHSYHGTEILKEMVDYGKKKFPEIEIYERNIMTDANVEICDIAVSSGIFYQIGKMDEASWKQYVFKMMEAHFKIAKQGAAFNFLTKYSTYTTPECCYFDPAEILDFCAKNLSRFIVIDHAYPLYEFTVTVLHKEHIRNSYPDSEYDKYFKA